MNFPAKIQGRVCALLFLLPIFVAAQDVSVNLSGYNLKGKVKSVMLEYSYVNPDIPYEEVLDYKSNCDITQTRYLKFDRYGNIVAELIDGRIRKNNPIDTTNLRITEYDAADRDKKLVVHKGYTPHPCYNPLEVRLNTVNYYIGNVFNDTDKYREVYDYQLDAEQRISREIYYCEIYETSPSDTLAADTWIDYIYDKDNRLVRQDIHHVERDQFNYSAIHLAHNLEFLYMAEKYRTLSYDAAGRLDTIAFYVNDERAYEETYTYNKEKGYIESVKRYLIPDHAGYDPPVTLVTYNEFGDITEVKYFSETLRARSEPSRYYEYEYDQQGNWIKCRLYLKGNKLKPTLVAEREIDYYKD